MIPGILLLLLDSNRTYHTFDIISDPAGSKRAEAFSEAFSHSKLFSTKNETPGKVLVLKHTILSQLPDSERKAVFSTTLWRVVGVVPGEAQKSTGGWCEGSNPPQGVPGDHSCENVLARV
jgi:hypothetical protein